MTVIGLVAVIELKCTSPVLDPVPVLISHSRSLLIIIKSSSHFKRFTNLNVNYWNLLEL